MNMSLLEVPNKQCLSNNDQEPVADPISIIGMGESLW